MNWQHINGIILVASLIVVAVCLGLWWAAVAYDFIGSTVFIGHISMLALVLGALGVSAGALAAWRTDKDA